MKSKLIFTSLLLLSCNAFAESALPNQELTPGVRDPRVTQENIHQTICVAGYTKTVRPDQKYTNSLKRKQMREYGYTNTDPRDFEEDHDLPLNLGGHPTDPKNLWPEPRENGMADKKDELEFQLQDLVCWHGLPLEEAQRAITTNWMEAYKKYGGKVYKGGKHKSGGSGFNEGHLDLSGKGHDNQHNSYADNGSKSEHEGGGEGLLTRLLNMFLNRTIRSIFHTY